MSEIAIADIKSIVDMMCPVKIILNGNIVWDDDTDDIAKFDSVFTSKSIVKEFSFEIVHCHHSIVTIIAE